MSRINFVLCLLAFGVLTPILPAQESWKSDSKVKATAAATKIDADGKQTVAITLEIAKGWHIFANPVGEEDFESERTVVTVAAKEKLTANVEYPPAKEMTIKFDRGENLTWGIYEGTVKIRATVKRTPGDTSPLKISVDLQATSAKSCLHPAVIKLTVPTPK